MVIDTSDDAIISTGEGERSYVELNPEEDAAEHEGSLGNAEDDSVSMLLEGSDIEMSATGSSHSRSTTPVNTPVGSKGKKRKKSKGEVIEEVMSKVMTNITETLKESDKNYFF